MPRDVRCGRRRWRHRLRRRPRPRRAPRAHPRSGRRTRPRRCRPRRRTSRRPRAVGRPGAEDVAGAADRLANRTDADDRRGDDEHRDGATDEALLGSLAQRGCRRRGDRDWRRSRSRGTRGPRGRRFEQSGERPQPRHQRHADRTPRDAHCTAGAGLADDGGRRDGMGAGQVWLSGGDVPRTRSDGAGQRAGVGAGSICGHPGRLGSRAGGRRAERGPPTGRRRRAQRLPLRMVAPVEPACRTVSVTSLSVARPPR